MRLKIPSLTIKEESAFKLMLFFLPFTQALTLNIGFPLKISELLLLFILLVNLVKLKVSRSSMESLKDNISLIYLFLAITISLVLNLLWTYSYPLKEIPSRIGMHGDSLLKFCYIFLAFSIFFVSIYYLKKKPGNIKYLIYGAITSAIYGWYLFLSSLFRIPYFKLIGMEENPQSILGIIRCGTFKEGNYMGLFLVLIAIVSLHIGRKKSAYFLMISVITTFSSGAFVGLFCFWVFKFRGVFFQRKSFIYFTRALPFLIVLVFFFSKTDFYEKYFYNKLFVSSTVVTQDNFSKVDRVMTSRIAFKQGLANPFFGVGPYKYGYHYDYYNDFQTYISNLSDYAYHYFRRSGVRAIPNNVYLEFLSEIGFIGLFLFLFFCLKVFQTSRKLENDSLFGGMIIFLIMINAFPTYSMLFIWVFLSIPYILKKVAI